MEISLEKIIEIVTREVIKDLINRGIKIEQSGNIGKSTAVKTDSLEIDMSGYKTPILTENHIQAIDINILKVIVPVETIITPGAKNIIKNKNLTIIYKS